MSFFLLENYFSYTKKRLNLREKLFTKARFVSVYSVENEEKITIEEQNITRLEKRKKSPEKSKKSPEKKKKSPDTVLIEEI